MTCLSPLCKNTDLRNNKRQMESRQIATVLFCKLDVHGSVHHSTILTVKNPTRCNSVSNFLLFLILNEAQHVSGDTPPIIRRLKLRRQPLVLHTWKVDGRAVVGRCQVAYERVHCTAHSPTLPDNVQQLQV